VQGALIEAARKAFGDVGELAGSGRTDAGVHALAQTAHVDLRAPRQLDEIVYGFNDNLPGDINVLGARSTDGRFHARHSAIARSYIYQISRRRSAFGKPFVWWVKDRLDLGAMRRASLALIGGHDYRSFTDDPSGTGETRVVVDEVMFVEAGDLILLRMRASHFLRKMVRRVVGSLVEIGRGTMEVDAISSALERPGDINMNWTAPPSGLFLEGVAYRGENLPRELTPAFIVGGERSITTAG